MNESNKAVQHWNSRYNKNEFGYEVEVLIQNMIIEN
jgi:hypothetical protein